MADFRRRPHVQISTSTPWWLYAPPWNLQWRAFAVRRHSRGTHGRNVEKSFQSNGMEKRFKEIKFQWTQPLLCGIPCYAGAKDSKDLARNRAALGLWIDLGQSLTDPENILARCSTRSRWCGPKNIDNIYIYIYIYIHIYIYTPLGAGVPRGGEGVGWGGVGCNNVHVTCVKGWGGVEWGVKTFM